jgi:uncharacterized protein (TIGR02118 family)
MFKVIILVTRKPGMSPADFAHHYETVHVPLVKRLVPQLVEYRRNFVEPGAGAPDFDAVTEMWFHDRAGYEALTALNADPIKGALLAEDAMKFMDAPKTRIFVVEEHGAP